MSLWQMLVVTAALIGMVVFAVWAIRLRAEGDPVWKLGGAMALVCLATGGSYLRPHFGWSITAFLATLLVIYMTWRFNRDRARAAS